MKMSCGLQLTPFLTLSWTFVNCDKKIMAVTSSIQSKSIKKFVLQQSNCNLDTSHDKDEDQKLLDKTVYEIKLKKDTVLETENQRSPQKVFKSEAKKLRSIRLDLSSLKRGVIQKSNQQKKESSEESSEDEVKNKRKPRPVVPNYVTNTDSGPCRKPRQSRQDPLVLSSQFPTRTSSQSLSIARRNARERNRVKQVNEGFASLRSRIPDYISDAYNEEKGRKGAKKLSKVETLRMALDYIRHLETLLDLKSEKEVWMKPIKVEEQPWETPHSGEFPSPKYQPPCVESPTTNYEQAFEYQERIFYECNLNFVPQKENEKKTATLTVLGNENQCVDDFKYYETFNRIKKEGSEDTTEKAVGEEEEEPDEEVIVKVEDQQVEEIEVEEEEKEEQRDPEVLLLPKDVIKKVPKSVLPSITESFNKTIPVFF